MEKLYDFYERYRDYILFLVLLIFMFISSAFIFWYFSDNLSSVRKEMKKNDESSLVFEEHKNELIVDIKGEVKKPGVYVLEDGKRVIDVIRKAGGFTKYADSSVNNLSMKLKDEMVIIIYSKNDVKDYLNTKKSEEIKTQICQSKEIINESCIDNNASGSNTDNKSSDDKNITDNSASNKDNNLENIDSNKLISINTASIEELMTLPSIGESKAAAIVEYRKTKRFEKIEDVMEVSGIGDKLYEKIKDYITT